MTGLLLAWMLIDAVATYGVWHFWRSFVPLEPAPQSPPVVVLVAIKGVGASTAGFLDSICRQRYPHYRLVFAVESADDPVHALIGEWRDRHAGRIDIDCRVAGLATVGTQKVHNLRAALAALRPDDRIVAFADADTQLPADWLTDLVRPIALGEVDASTGYRWPLPTDRAWATLVGAAADLSITTAARSWRWNVCWGGSCAVSRSALDAINLPAVWSGVASDDVTLTRALRDRGLRINAPLRVLVPSPVSHTWPQLFAFARRQHLMVRTYAPRVWVFGGAVLCVPMAAACAGLASVARNGSAPATAALIASFAMLQLRIVLRRRIAAAILPPAAIRSARATINFSAWTWPLVNATHCAAFLSSCAGSRFEWAGVRYRIDGREARAERAQGPDQ